MGVRDEHVRLWRWRFAAFVGAVITVGAVAAPYADAWAYCGKRCICGPWNNGCEGERREEPPQVFDPPQIFDPPQRSKPQYVQPTPRPAPARPHPQDVARDALEAGRFDEADGRYRQLLRGDPDNGHLLHQLGYIAAKKGNIELALHFYRRALKGRDTESNKRITRGNLVRTLHTVADMRRRAKDFALAEKHYREAWAINRNDPFTLNQIGLMLTEQKSFEQARPILLRAYALRGRLSAEDQKIVRGNYINCSGRAAELALTPDASAESLARSIAFALKAVEAAKPTDDAFPLITTVYADLLAKSAKTAIESGDAQRGLALFESAHRFAAKSAEAATQAGKTTICCRPAGSSAHDGARRLMAEGLYDISLTRQWIGKDYARVLAAEARKLPPSDVAKRMELLRRAQNLSPDDADIRKALNDISAGGNAAKPSSEHARQGGSGLDLPPGAAKILDEARAAASLGRGSLGGTAPVFDTKGEAVRGGGETPPAIDGAAVDGRAQPVLTVPEAVRANPKWQDFQRERATIEQELARSENEARAVRKRLDSAAAPESRQDLNRQLNEIVKGIDKAESRLSVVKQSQRMLEFNISIDEKPAATDAPKANDNRGDVTQGKAEQKP